MTRARRRLLQLARGALALPAITRSAWAQAYPTGPLRLVVPLPAGGAADIVARHMAPWLERLGQPRILANKPGARTHVGGQAGTHPPPHRAHRTHLRPP